MTVSVIVLCKGLLVALALPLFTFKLSPLVKCDLAKVSLWNVCLFGFSFLEYLINGAQELCLLLICYLKKPSELIRHAVANCKITLLELPRNNCVFLFGSHEDSMD